MGWIYYEIQQKDDAFNEALNIFLNQCLINKERIEQFLTQNNCYRFIIKTDDIHDKVYCCDGSYFLKSRFLKNKIFKKKLVDYYKPLNIFVSGPKEIFRKDGTCMNKWLIELHSNGKYLIVKN